MTHRGFFITFEGLDGSGKTTQIRLLAGRFRAVGREVVETAEPGGTRIGARIRDLLLDPAHRELSPTAEMLLYFSSRAQNVDEVILPALGRGAVVISDRFTDSTMVYQGYGRELGEAAVNQLHEIACRGLQPDITVFLDIDVEAGLSRMRRRNSEAERSDRMDKQTTDFHRRVREAYLSLAARHPERIRVIRADQPVETVAAGIWEVVAVYV